MKERIKKFIERKEKRVFNSEEFQTMVTNWSEREWVEEEVVNKALASLEKQEIEKLIKLFFYTELTLTPIKHTLNATIAAYIVTESAGVDEGLYETVKLFIGKSLVEMLLIRLSVAAFFSWKLELPTEKRRDILLREALIPWVGRFAPIYSLMKDHPEFVKLFLAYQRSKKVYRENNDDLEKEFDKFKHNFRDRISQRLEKWGQAAEYITH